MKRNVGLTYGEFEFPAEQGFTGSRAKGYKHGGAVKKSAHQSMPPNVKKHGGVVKKAMGGFMGPEREITVDDVTISTPRAKGGRVGMHDKLKSAGAKLGFKYGGQVKNTSAEFVEKHGKQATMDDGVQPARRGKNARNQAEAEAGGTGRLKPGLNRGGRVGKGMKKGAKYKTMMGSVAHKGLKKLKGVMSDADRLAASEKGMPATVKARGGLAAHVAKARGGSVKK